MGKIAYTDFDLLLENTGGVYSARVLNSPAGEIKSEFKIPFSDLEIENMLLRVGRTRRGIRRLESPEMETARIFGARLFDAVFDNEIRGSLRSAMNDAYRQGMGVRIKLHLTNALDLADLPWEFLYDPTSQRFLVLSVSTPLVRYIDLPLNIQPYPVSRPLRVLVMISSPNDYPPLDVDLEWAKLKEAVGDLENQGALSLTRTDDATLLNLQHLMRRDEYHIFHYIGHGTFDRQSQDGLLLFEDERNLGRPISGRQLGTILHDHRSLRLVIMNTCEGARTSRDDPFAGAAQSLVQQGIPAVIAMQFEITDKAAITLAREFYGAVADGYPIDAALSEARKALFSQGNDIEWGTPVLYLRSKDGQIFDVAAGKDAPAKEVALEAVKQAQPAVKPILQASSEKSPDAALEQRLAQMYTDGLSAFWLEDWEIAAQKFQSLLELRPGYRDAGAKLDTIRKQQRLAGLDQQAVKGESAGDWETAVTALEALANEAPDYKNAAARLETAHRRQRLASLYAETHQLYSAQKWQAVVNVFEQIASLDPSYPDPDGLLKSASLEIEKGRKAAEVEQLYTQALTEIEAGQWLPAKKLLIRVLTIEPNHSDANRLKARVESELRPKPLREEPVLQNLSRQAPFSLKPAQEKLSRPQPMTLNEPLADERVQPAHYDFARQILMFMGGGAAARVISDWLMNYSNNFSNEPIPKFIGMTMSGIVVGLVVLGVLRLSKIFLNRNQALALCAGWAISYFFGMALIAMVPGGIYGNVWPNSYGLAGIFGGLVTGYVLRKAGHPILTASLAALPWMWMLSGVMGGNVFSSNTVNAWPFGYGLASLLGGLATGFVLRKAGHPISTASLAALSGVWALGGIMGDTVFSSIYGSLYDVLGNFGVTTFGNIASGAVAGLAGGWITLQVLDQHRDDNAMLKTARIAAAGVALAVLTANLLSKSLPDTPLVHAFSFALIGAISMLSFTFPERNIRQMVVPSLLVAAGAAVIGFFYNSIGTQLGGMIYGVFIGLSLGFLLKQRSALLIMGLTGLSILVFTSWLFEWDSDRNFVFLTTIIGGAISGAVLGFVFASLNRSTKISS